MLPLPFGWSRSKVIFSRFPWRTCDRTSQRRRLISWVIEVEVIESGDGQMNRNVPDMEYTLREAKERGGDRSCHWWLNTKAWVIIRSLSLSLPPLAHLIFILSSPQISHHEALPKNTGQLLIFPSICDRHPSCTQPIEWPKWHQTSLQQIPPRRLIQYILRHRKGRL